MQASGKKRSLTNYIDDKAVLPLELLCLILLLLPFAAAEPVPDYDRPYSPIFTDKPAYSWTEKVKITIHAPSWNTDRHLIDDIGSDPDHSIKISTGGSSLSEYKLTEADVNNGVFTGEVILTGFPHDVDGDGDSDTDPRTAGSGPTGGFLETDRDSALTVSFEFADGVVVTESVPISWNVGQVQFLNDSYSTGQWPVVRVTDADMNLNPEAIDRLEIMAHSDSFLAGIWVDAIETDPDSGVFEAEILTETIAANSGYRLRALPGDAVYAVYEDRTLPRPYSTSDELDIEARTQVTSGILPTEKTRIHDVSFSDGLGNPVDALTASQKIQVVGGLANNQQFAQPFAYLVQIRDSENHVVKLSWVSGVLRAQDLLRVSQSWIPNAPGDYAVESYVWESVPSAVPISEPDVTRVSVR